jgi:MFS family permease
MRFVKSVYHGWWILGGAVVAQFVAASIGFMAAGVFLEPLVEDLRIQVWQFSLAVATANALGGVAVFVVGPMVDQIGPRRIMLFGAIFGSIGLAGLSMQSTFWQFFLLQGMSSALGWTLFGPLVINATLTKWFIARRGWALALGSTGVSFAGLITPVSMTIVVDSVGWRAGYLAMAGIVLLTIVPVALFMRRQPEDMGLLPDGPRPSIDSGPESGRPTAAILADDRQTYTRRQALKTANFWLINLGYGLNAAALGSIALHAMPFATSVGFTRAVAATGLGINGLGNLSSKIVWGWGLQRFDPRRLAGMAFTTSAIGVLLLVQAGTLQDSATLMVGFFLYGFGFGGTIPISEFLWATYFGRRHIAAIRGVGRPISIILGMLGPIATGAWFDNSGSYVSAFVFLVFVYIAGAVILNLSKKPSPLDNSSA